jgi:GIY-YIG catalytic domain
MKKNERVSIISEIAQLWPRDIFYLRDGKKYIEDITKLLKNKTGVYILYRDDVPYYIGKSNNLFRRLAGYARNPNSKYYNFWNFFTVFVVSNQKYLEDVEGILIKAMPLTDNSSKPRMKRIKIPSKVARHISGRKITQYSQLVIENEYDED